MRVVLLAMLVLSAEGLFGQNYVPDDLKTSKLIMIKYEYENWDSQYLDSTKGQWVWNRYGEKILYNNYLETFDKAATTLKRLGFYFVIVDSQSSYDKTDFKYCFDYKQKVIDNLESIVADKDLGGFFFEDIQTKKRYEPIGENKK